MSRNVKYGPAENSAEQLFADQFKIHMNGHVGNFKTSYPILYRKVIIPLIAKLISDLWTVQMNGRSRRFYPWIPSTEINPPKVGANDYEELKKIHIMFTKEAQEHARIYYGKYRKYRSFFWMLVSFNLIYILMVILS